MSYPNYNALAIAGGDPLVGHALEQILQSAGYDARFLDNSSTNRPPDPLRGASLLLLAPRTSGAEREAILGRLRNGLPDTLAVPVLKLVSASDEGQDEEEVGARRVLWPCQLKDLRREIEAALLDNSS